MITQEQLQEELARCTSIPAAVIKQELQEAMTKMLLKHAFFAHVILQLRQAVMPGHGYAASVGPDGTSFILTIGGFFCNQYETFENRVFTLVHEVEHIVRLHFTRSDNVGAKPGSDLWELWKIAVDLEINQDPVVGMPDPPLIVDYTCYKLPAGLSAEQYLKLLVDVQKEQAGQPRQGDKDDEGRYWLPQPGEKAAQHTSWDELREKLDPEGLQEAAKEIVNAALRQGDAPAHLSEFIENLNKQAKLPWTSLLRRYVSSKVAARRNRTWQRLNRRLPYELIKGHRKGEGSKIVFVCDTSGSISKLELRQALTELRGISATRTAQIWLLQCDAAVQWAGRLDHMPADIQIKGRGGTDFRPAFKWVEDNKIGPDVMVFMTDGYGTYPEEPSYPVIWLCTENSKIEAGWGLQVRYPKV